MTAEEADTGHGFGGAKCYQYEGDAQAEAVADDEEDAAGGGHSLGAGGDGDDGCEGGAEAGGPA